VIELHDAVEFVIAIYLVLLMIINLVIV